MENFTTWILVVASILYNQVVCSDDSKDYEVFHTTGSGPNNDYVGSHNAFLWKYFDKPAEYKIGGGIDDDDEGYGTTNDKYQQAPDVEQFVDSYDKAYDDSQYDRIKSMTHHQSQESEPTKKCKVVVMGEMLCKVCKDSEGTHSKSCSVDTVPPKQKYEYTQQRLAAYNSADDGEKKKGDNEEEQPEQYWEA